MMGTTRRQPPTWLLIVATWLAAYAARPFLLGFYNDDWTVLLVTAQQTAPFSWARLSYLMTLFANRPVMGLSVYLVSSVAGESAPAWHVAAAALALLAAFALRGFFRQVLLALEHPARWPADLAAALWLAFPWQMGLTAWPVVSTDLLAVTLFAASGMLLLRGWRRGETPWLIPALLFLAACLTYEAFYGQFILLLLLPPLLLRRQRRDGRRLLRCAASLSAAQLLAAGWNRIVAAYISAAPSKGTFAAPLQRWTENITGLRYAIGHAAAEVSPLLELALAALLGLGGLAAIYTLLRPTTRRDTTLGLVGLAFVAVLGVSAALALLSVAGYQVRGTNAISRVTIAINVWLAVGLLVALVSLTVARPGRVAGQGLGAAVLVLCLLSTWFRMQDWAAAWELQQSILAAAPVEELRAAAPDAIILFAGPTEIRNAPVFGYTWDINRAMQYTYPDLQHLRFYRIDDDTVTTWDGHAFVQQLRRPGQHAVRKTWNETSTSEAWRWDQEASSLTRLTPPLRLPHDTARKTPD